MSRFISMFAAEPSFLTGLARILDLWATMGGHSYNNAKSPAEADALATWNDWLAVGDDFGTAIDGFQQDAEEVAA